MQQQNLLLRDDTFLGVCEAIGQDFGFHPNWLRIALAVALFFNPLAVVFAYASLAVVVAGTRLAFPASRAEDSAPAAPVAPDAPVAPTAPSIATNVAEERQAEVALAA